MRPSRYYLQGMRPSYVTRHRVALSLTGTSALQVEATPLLEAPGILWAPASLAYITTRVPQLFYKALIPKPQVGG